MPHHSPEVVGDISGLHVFAPEPAKMGAAAKSWQAGNALEQQKLISL
jgi:hypothetical protein